MKILLCLLVLSVSAGPKESTEQLVHQAAAVFSQKNIEMRKKEGMILFHSHFDFEKFAQLTLEDHWRHLTSAQRKAFLTIFRKRFEERVLQYFEKKPGTFSVKIKGRGKFGKFKKIDCRLQSDKRSGDFSLLWIRKRQDWKIADIWVSNASLVGNYQGQFNKIIRDHGFEEVLKRLNE